MLVYISGPMTGKINFNREAFNQAEKDLKKMGFVTINPARNQLGPDATWTDYMRKDIRQLMDAEAIYLLEGWEQSKGARLEFFLACELGMQIMTQK